MGKVILFLILCSQVSQEHSYGCSPGFSGSKGRGLADKHALGTFIVAFDSFSGEKHRFKLSSYQTEKSLVSLLGFF